MPNHRRKHGTYTDGQECFYCAKCGNCLPPEDYNFDNKAADGRQSTCRNCEKQWRTDNEEQLREWQKGYLEEYKKTENYKIQNFIRNDKKRQTYVWWNAVQESIMYELFGTACVWCDRASNEIDHFIPVARGGKTIPGNMCPICRKCNMAKFDREPLDFARKIFAVERYNWIVERLNEHYIIYSSTKNNAENE